MIKRAGNIFTTAYLVIMFCVYPFYIENGYINIGEAKNHFFLCVTMAACVVFTVLCVARCISGITDKRRNGQHLMIDFNKVSGIDLLVLLFATQIFLSYVSSNYKGVTLWGEEGWYMGLVPLLLLCGIYFFISRLWQGDVHLAYLIMGASAVVFLLGICNRYSFYPISLAGSQPGFISTLGNINWFCGFLSVVAPIGIGMFVIEDHVWKKAAAGLYAVITFMTGFVQGSDSIFLWYFAVFFLLLWIAVGKKEYVRNFFLLLTLFGLSAQMVKVLGLFVVDNYNHSTEGLCGYFMSSSISLWITGMGLAGFLLTGRNTEGKKEIGQGGAKKAKGILLGSVVVILLTWLIMSIIHTKSGISFLQGRSLFMLDGNWGHGRGTAFLAGIKTFVELPPLQKLFGVGPDGFASAVYGLPEIAIMLRRAFGEARLTNAHNEIITGLINTGALGVLLYVSLLLTAMSKFIKKGREQRELYLYALCIFGYFIHNMVSFAQVLNIPFLFMILGMGEAICRKQKNL